MSFLQSNFEHEVTIYSECQLICAKFGVIMKKWDIECRLGVKKSINSVLFKKEETDRLLTERCIFKRYDKYCNL